MKVGCNISLIKTGPVKDKIRKGFFFWSIAILSLSVIQKPCIASEEDDEFSEFPDSPLIEDIVLPGWFKLSFLEIDSDLKEARKGGKAGLVLYFGQKDCAYCKEHLKNNWGDRGIIAYTRKYFDVVAIDVRGNQPVTGIDGVRFKSEKAYSIALKTNFTPSLVFINTSGKEVLRLTGYHPPYDFRAALEYVADEHYKSERFGAYLARGETIVGYEESELNTNALFSLPPFALDRRQFPGQFPLMVIFERETCHSCDVFHNTILKNKKIIESMKQLEVVQLNIKSETPVLTPDGLRLTATKWASKLDIYYSPTVVFFDVSGAEILRIDSVIGFYRLNNVMHFLLTKGYAKYPNFQQWRQATNR